jgi:stress-induced morphogen
MARKRLKKPEFVNNLTDALQKQYGPDVQAQHVSGSRYRFEVISKKFVGKRHPDRQRALWKIVDQVVPKEHILDVAMIMAVATDELYENVS